MTAALVDPRRALAGIVCSLRQPVRMPEAVGDDLVRAARDEGFGPIVYYALHAIGAWGFQSDQVRRDLGELAARAALLEQIRLSHARTVLQALGRNGVAPLVFKGAALAYRHYPEPWLRPRVDTDLFIKREDATRTEQAFERLGIGRALRPRGDNVTHQQTYQGTVDGVGHEYDVHWKIWDPAVFADAFRYDELYAQSVPLPPLGDARAVGDVHGLLIACAHRVAHHFDAGPLVWLYDIDALSRSLDADQWAAFARLAAEKRMRRVCARGLALAADYFQTAVPDGTTRLLADSPDDEETAAYLRAGLRRVDILKSDLHALGWRGRAALMREHLFPEPSYMLRSYGRTRRVLLPALYLHRIVRGAAAWFRPLR